ncbi:MAG TPA: hypothetical protein VIU64_21290 [Polyangia bacterium]
MVSLPLVTETGGHRYRLRNAAISISGPQYLQLATSDDPAETVLSASLPTGTYYAYLYSSWRLERDDGSGRFLPVQAEMLSSYYTSFSILNGATTTLGFRFRTDGVIVEVGAGQLKVNVSVEETSPICTPFATPDGCADGSWCPPTGLTALPRACVATGTIALGLPCLAALDCGRGAACIEGAAGPVCTALCPSSDDGLACATGGTCQAVRTDYGVCVPSSPEPMAPEGDRAP